MPEIVAVTLEYEIEGQDETIRYTKNVTRKGLGELIKFIDDKSWEVEE